MIKNLLRITLSMAALTAAWALPAAAQTTGQTPFPVTIEKQLATRASNYTEVTLDRKMLDFASHFMDKEDDAEGKRIVAKLNGIYVRTYEFDKPDQYTPEDLEAIRRQFQSSDWSPLVKERSKGGTDDSDIYMKVVNGQVEGMFILNAESKELNFVYISGPISPDDLDDLRGNFGIPSGKMSGKDKAQANEEARKAAKLAQQDKKEAQQP
jgi:hypothetical protein